MKDDWAFLQHISEAIADIKRYTAGGEMEFFGTKMIQDAVIRNLEIVGEAVKNLSPALKERNPDIPWQKIAGLRDVLIHHYFGVDLDSVWLVVVNRLPPLAKSIEQILAEDHSC